MTQPFDVVILGCGYTGRAVAERARAARLSVCGTVRSEARAAALRAAGIEVVRADVLDADVVRPLIGPKSYVVIAFPPDGTTERAILPTLRDAAAMTFVSSTGVYGATAGRIGDDTPIPAERSVSTKAYLTAETHSFVRSAEPRCAARRSTARTVGCICALSRGSIAFRVTDRARPRASTSPTSPH